MVMEMCIVLCVASERSQRKTICHELHKVDERWRDNSEWCYSWSACLPGKCLVSSLVAAVVPSVLFLPLHLTVVQI